MLVGVDVGGTNLRIGVVDGLRVVVEHRIQADFAGLCRSLPPVEALGSIRSVLADCLKATLRNFPAVTAIGIGFPGFIDPVTGNVAQSPNLPGLRDVDLATPLREQLGLPVIVENDALAAAYGEFMLAGLEMPGLIYLGLGTGVGGGLIHGGKPFPGEHGVAMEVGHLIVEPGGRPCGCGNRGCLEQYASASGVTISYFEATGMRKEASEIAQLAQSGDAQAVAAYALAGDRLAMALAHILKVVDIANVIIGGGMSLAWPLMGPAFEHRLEVDLIPVLRGKIRTTISGTGDQAGIIGAALLAKRQLPT